APGAAHDDLESAVAQLPQVGEEALHEAVFRLLAIRRARPGRQVEGDHRQVLVDRLEVAPFRIELLVAEADDEPLGRPPAIESDPAIALLLGRMEVPLELADAPHLLRNIGLGGLDLLDTDEIGGLRRNPFMESLALRGAEIGRAP